MLAIDGVLATLAGRAGVKRDFDAGETVFLAGAPVRSIFVVLSGRVRMLRRNTCGGEITLHRAVAGESFAEASLFADRYHCDAVTDVPTQLLAYPQRDILAALRRNPGHAVLLMGYLARQVQSARARAEILGMHSARDRILAYLHMQAAGDDGIVEITQTWKQLATELGLTHEAVYRALARLERDGLIARDGPRVRLSARRQP